MAWADSGKWWNTRKILSGSKWPKGVGFVCYLAFPWNWGRMCLFLIALLRRPMTASQILGKIRSSDQQIQSNDAIVSAKQSGSYHTRNISKRHSHTTSIHKWSYLRARTDNRRSRGKHQSKTKWKDMPLHSWSVLVYKRRHMWSANGVCLRPTN